MFRRFLAKPGAFLLAVALVAGLTLVAAPAQAKNEPRGQLTGKITDSKTKKGLSKIRVELFTADWKYLKAKVANSRGTYWFGSLRRGTYRVKFVDTRPTYDVTAHVTKDSAVRVRKVKNATVHNVRISRGASITGRVTAGGKKAKKSRLLAVNQYGGTYQVTADKSGRFAIGGLSKGNYSVFAFDYKLRFTGPSVYIRGLKLRTSRNVTIRMKTRAGAFAGPLTAGGRKLKATVWVTAVNRKSGQFWVQKIKRGNLGALRGLAPGKYKIIVPDAAGYRGRTINYLGTIKSRKTTDVRVNLNRRLPAAVSP